MYETFNFRGNMEKLVRKRTSSKIIIRKCHSCSHLNESAKEIERCTKCQKSFMPLNYFEKVHERESSKYKELFANSYEISEEDIIKGIFVLW